MHWALAADDGVLVVWLGAGIVEHPGALSDAQLVEGAATGAVEHSVHSRGTRFAGPPEFQPFVEKPEAPRGRPSAVPQPEQS